MSSNSSTATGHEKYYVPESSSLAVRATIGLLLSVFGGGLMLNDMILVTKMLLKTTYI